jgi:hypothetical protein
MLIAAWDPKEKMLEVTVPREVVDPDGAKDRKRNA